MVTSNDWNDLPDIALIFIYLNLSDTDRLNVACTCKNWNRLFSTAILWRKRRVVFDANAPEIMAENEVKFLDQFGHCLTKLTLNFGRPTFKSCMNISKAVENYLKRMCSRNDIRLRELDLENLHMEQHWHFILSRNRLVTAMCKMIRKQRYLETVFMAGARMRLVDGCRVLEALGKAKTRSKIRTLYIEDFFETNMFPWRHPRFVSAMSKFQVLEDVHLNYRYLSSVLLRNIANKQSKSIKTLSLVFEGDVRGVEIPADAWMEFTEKCPLTEVGVYLCTTVLRGTDLRTPFVRGLPLKQIYLTSWSRIDETESRLATLLRHLGNMYNTSLGNLFFRSFGYILDLDKSSWTNISWFVPNDNELIPNHNDNFAMFFEHHEFIDNDLLYMLRRCRRITDLCIQARLSAVTVVEIMKLHYQGKIVLKTINLTIPGLTNDQWEWVEAERIRYLNDVSDFVHIGPNEFGSSIGGSTITLEDDDDVDVVGVDDNDDNAGGDDGIDFMFRANNFEVDISDDENDIFRPPAGFINDDDDDEDLLI